MRTLNADRANAEGARLQTKKDLRKHVLLSGDLHVACGGAGTASAALLVASYPADSSSIATRSPPGRSRDCVLRAVTTTVLDLFGSIISCIEG